MAFPQIWGVKWDGGYPFNSEGGDSIATKFSQQTYDQMAKHNLKATKMARIPWKVMTTKTKRRNATKQRKHGKIKSSKIDSRKIASTVSFGMLPVGHAKFHAIKSVKSGVFPFSPPPHFHKFFFVRDAAYTTLPVALKIIAQTTKLLEFVR